MARGRIFHGPDFPERRISLFRGYGRLLSGWPNSGRRPSVAVLPVGGLLLQVAGDPSRLRACEKVVGVRFVIAQRPVVEVRRVLEVAGRARGFHLDVEHAARDRASLAGRQQARILDRVVEEKQ